MGKDQKILTIILQTLYFTLVGILCFYIVYNAAFVLGDQDQYIETTALGKFFNSMRFGKNRFYPLGNFELNLAILFGGSAVAHFVVNIIVYILFAIFALALCRYCVPKHTNANFLINILCVVSAAVVIIARVYSMFLEIIYPEKMLCTMLAVFLFCGVRFFQTDKGIYGVLALLSAIYATYCKEVVFGAMIVFGVIPLLFGYKTLSKNQKIFSTLLIVEGFIYICIYTFFIYRSNLDSYSLYNSHGNYFTLIFAMLRSQKMVAIAVLFAIWRTYALIIMRDKEHLIFDAMLFAGVAYFCGMIILNASTNYFFMPCVVLTVPAILHFSIFYFKQWGGLLIIGLLALFYLIKVPTLIKGNQYVRKNDPILIQGLADYHKQGYNLYWYESDNLHEDRSIFMRYYYWTTYDKFIRYEIRDEKYKLAQTNNIKDKVDENYIILYHKENCNNNLSEVDSLIAEYTLEQVLNYNKGIYILKHDIE